MLIEYARQELQRAGLFDKDGDYGGDLGPAVLKVVEVFAEEGHSGGSAGIAIGAINRLLRFQPLTPLTGADDEWNEVGEGMWQNRRCSTVFKDASGKAYDVGGSGNYRVSVSFPYTPD